ncbi:MAG: cysteine desulfurase [bacterium]|nr:cysteine desulfurase [bacterium]
MQDSPIYLDYNATTPPAPEVIEAMLPALRDLWGNPSSAHAFGQPARRAVDAAREQVAALIGCAADEVIFTCGGTESDNAAIVGIAEALADRGKHIVISAVEHAAIDNACAYLERNSWRTTRVPVDRNGRVDAKEFVDSLRDETALVSIMHSNNETGVIQPVREIADAAHERGIVVHSDTAQSLGKVALTADDLGVDSLTVAGHKLYGPKGAGALYLRRDTPFNGFLRGAGHEGGRRGGTENVAGIVGLGAACELARRELPQRTEHLLELRDRLEQRLRDRVPELVVHGKSVERLPNTLSAAFPGVDANHLLSLAEGVASAAGAACHSGKPHISRVLAAMGVSDELALATVRLTVGCPTRTEDVDRAAERLGAAYARSRAS